MAAKLVAEEGVLKGLVLSLEGRDQWIIGRDPETCQLLIEDPSASRKHLLCRVSPEGIVAENLSNTNPIQVNEEEITAPRLLQNGDALKIGSGTFRFYSESAALIHEDGAQEPGESSEAQPENHKEVSMPQTEVKEELPIEEPVQAGESAQPREPESSPQHDSIFEDDAGAKTGLAEINFDLFENGRWLLKVIGGPNNGAEFSMQSDSSYLIGTDPNTCDIVFHDNSVSRQHARITIAPDDTITIEDLKSRNGTLLDGEPLKDKHILEPNALVTMGTTSFITYDREGEMQTIISPLMPSIVKVLQQKEEDAAKKEQEAAAAAAAALAATSTPPPAEKPHEKVNNALGAFILIAIITGLFVIVGIGTTTLFKSEPVVSQEHIDADRLLQQALAPFPTIKSTYNKNTGTLLLVGHVLSGTDKAQLMYNLQGMKFIKAIDDSGVIIDEYVWREINPVLAKNPAWASVNIYSPTPGHFVLSGYLQTRKQAEQLWDYISNNFQYVDLLDKRIVVEEDVISQVSQELQRESFRDVNPQLSNGELTLTGFIPAGKAAVLATLISDFKQIQGVRDVRSFVSEQAPDASMINLSDRYEVTGYSNTGHGTLNVVINGRILSRGDIMDGMSIISIKPNVIFLEKDGVKYRIDYGK